MNCECIYLLKPEDQNVENYLELAKSLDNSGKDYDDPSYIERFAAALAVITHPVTVSNDINVGWYEGPTATLGKGNIVLFVQGKLANMNPYYLFQDRPALALFPDHSADFYKDIILFDQDTDYDALKETLKFPKSPKRAEKEEDVYSFFLHPPVDEEYYGNSFEPINEDRIVRLYDTNIDIGGIWDSYRVYFKIIETEKEYQLWGSFGVDNTEIRLLTKKKSLYENYDAFYEYICKHAGTEIDEFVLLYELMEKLRCEEDFDESEFLSRDSSYSGSVKLSRIDYDESKLKRFRITDPCYEGLVMEIDGTNFCLSDGNLRDFEFGCGGCDEYLCFDNIVADNVAFFYERDDLERAKLLKSKVRGALRNCWQGPYNPVKKIKKHFYYYINSGKYNKKLDYYYDLAKHISHYSFGAPVSIEKAANDFTVMTYVDDGECDGIRKVKIRKGTLLLHAYGTGLDENSHILFETWDDEFFCQICEIDFKDVKKDDLNTVTDFGDCISDGLMFTSYGDGTCSVFASGIKNNRKIITVPEYSPAGDKVIAVEDHGFAHCQMKKLILSDSVEAIGHQTFFGCNALREIECREPLQYIRDDAFEDCLITVPQSDTGDKAYSKETGRSLFFVGYYQNPNRGADTKSNEDITVNDIESIEE